MRSTLTTLCLVTALGCSRNPPAPPAATPATTAQTTQADPTPEPASPRPAAGNAAAASLTVESPARTAIMAEGDAAPTFRAVTHDGTAVASDGLARSRVLVVYFYPRDETPGCTAEACAFRDAFSAYREAGADIIGVSTDGADAHRGFATHHSLPFGLVADTDGRLAQAFGLPVTAGGYAPRTTFVIGRNGRVARVFPAVQVTGHSEQVLAAVRAAR